MTITRVGFAIMKDPDDPKLVMSASGGKVCIRTTGMNAAHLTIEEAKKMRRSLSRLIRELEDPAK